VLIFNVDFVIHHLASVSSQIPYRSYYEQDVLIEEYLRTTYRTILLLLLLLLFRFVLVWYTYIIIPR